MTKRELYEMDLHEEIELIEQKIIILRVFNGWIYTQYKFGLAFAVFVPEKVKTQ